MVAPLRTTGVRSPATTVSFPRLLGPLAVPAGATVLLALTSLNAVTPLQGALAFVLAAVPWLSFQSWRLRRDSILPLSGLIATFYWLYFAVPLFWGDRTRPSAGATSIVSNNSVTAAMILATLAVLSIFLGAHTGIGRRVRLSSIPILRSDSRGMSHVRLLFLVTLAFSLVPDVAYVGGEQFRQIVLALQTSVPLVAYVVLLRAMLSGEGQKVDVVLVVAYLAITFVTGLSSGWLGSWLNPVLASIFTYLWVRGRVPLVAVLAVIIYALFFQVGKAEFRGTYWYGSSNQSTRLDRVGAWVGLASTQWQNALVGQSQSTPLDLFRETVLRTSLLPQTANVIDQTPADVPYQLGSTYSYAVQGFVPRLLWPGKPSANEANRFYQVAYGLTSQQNLSGVSIAVGTATEAYINFGWPGVIGIMLLLGILFDFVQASFLAREAGTFAGAIGILFALHFIIIEAQLGEYLNGVVQQSLVVGVLFLPALTWRRARRIAW